MCKKRVTLAGYRLANLVISIYENNIRLIDVEKAWKELIRENIKIYQSEQ